MCVRKKNMNVKNMLECSKQYITAYDFRSQNVVFLCVRKKSTMDIENMT